MTDTNRSFLPVQWRVRWNLRPISNSTLISKGNRLHHRTGSMMEGMLRLAERWVIFTRAPVVGGFLFLQLPKKLTCQIRSHFLSSSRQSGSYMVELATNAPLSPLWNLRSLYTGSALSKYHSRLSARNGQSRPQRYYSQCDGYPRRFKLLYLCLEIKGNLES